MLWEWDDSRKQVFILDLDGTLMPCAKIDNECFWDAVFDCFGNSTTLPVLHEFTNVTDIGILNEWCVRELGRLPHKKEKRQIKQRFFQRLESASIRQPQGFQPFPGVISWLEKLAESRNVYSGIATGGWQHTARLKLKLAGLDRFDLPLASSDDAIKRTDIMHIAARRVFDDQPHNEAVFTYVGDGVWDLQASRELDWEFIGIASGAQARKLRLAGAVDILANFVKN
jgi:phosphoglycolate phosphatase-like HAD superfamily hydrolase